MALRKTVDIDVDGDRETALSLVRAYNGRVDYDCEIFIGARVSKARLSHLKSTATKKGLSVYVYEQ